MYRGIVLGAVLVFCAVAASGAATAETPTTVVIDGDTLEIDNKTVRLYGIDAPELGQFCLNGGTRYRCGYEAALILRKLVGSESIACQPTPVDPNDPGQICSAGLVDLAEAMLLNGYAVALPDTFAFYRRAEQKAKQSKLGLWRGDFVPPEEWRAGRRLQPSNDEAAQSCDIKGIVSDTGGQVYLVPSDPEYASVVIGQLHGERLFCSDDEAELAGWRRWPKAAIQQRAAAKKN